MEESMPPQDSDSGNQKRLPVATVAGYRLNQQKTDTGDRLRVPGCGAPALLPMGLC